MHHTYLQKIVFTLAFFGASFFAFGQTQNAFWSREFWTNTTTVETVKEKIEAGNDPVAKNGRAFDATTNAILGNAPQETILYLLSLNGNGANKITHDGRNYIFWAAMKQNLPVMQKLVEMGADMTLVDSHGLNALTFAVATGVTNPDVYDFLIANGADVNFKDHNGASALLLMAGFDKDFGMMDYFMSKGLDLYAQDENGNSAFNYAARTGNYDMMNMLMEKNVIYKEPNKLGENAMFFAATGARRIQNDVNVFEFLKNQGIAPNQVSTDGRTALHIAAARSNDLEVIHFFVENGTDPNQIDNAGNSALMNAAARGSLEKVQFLAEQTAEINQQNNDGKTALNNALRSNTAEVVNFLIEQNAMFNAYSAEELVASFSPKKSIEFEEKLAALQRIGFNPKNAFDGGNTLLHYAAKTNNLSLIKTVVATGVDVNAKNEEGYTALHIAAMKATDDVVLKYLLENGADKKITTGFDESAFDLAKENEMLKAEKTNLKFLKS